MHGVLHHAHRVTVAGLAACVTSLTSCSLVLDWNGYTGGDAGFVVDGGDAAPPPPACSSQNCGGCCEATGCAEGLSATSCGQGGEACRNCAGQGLLCSGGACTTPPVDSGPPADSGPPCSLIACKTLLTCLASIDIACCKPDGTCGCEAVLGPSVCH